MIFGDGSITIGDNVCIGNGTILYASQNGGITIGKNTVIAAQCYIIDMDHGFKAGELILSQPNTVDEVVIGEDVWLAANTTILKGSKIGDGAVIGAKSLVKGEIPENAIAVGIPAKVLKYRS
jgi:acetyltransferase-like isoleucine patch superfamily enzyme